MKRYLNPRAAFTLLEIMLVVLIISLLIGMAVHYTAGHLEEARQVKVRGDLQQIKTNLMMYQAANGFYPSTEQGLKALVQKPDGDPKPRNWRQLNDEVPRDPWDQEYFYRFPGKHNPKEYDIFSAGPDRNPDTEEDNLGNWESRTN
ncbi:MAG: type II secretion system major pseudopilin GspG [Chthoniobacter sp.]|nr:type II secretion system major pseudopilin GspG [Chthoniobacter sp.]